MEKIPVSGIVEQLRIATAIPICKPAADEIETLRQQLENERTRGIHSRWPSCTRNGCVNRRLRVQLAASQAREQQLRDALFSLAVEGKSNSFEAQEALALPADTSALEALVTKAGEVAIARAIAAASAINPIYGAGAAIDAIRALPGVALEDLQ